MSASKLFSLVLYGWCFFWGLSLVKETRFSAFWDVLVMVSGVLIMFFSVWATIELLRTWGKKKENPASQDATTYASDFPDEPASRPPSLRNRPDSESDSDTGSSSDAD